MGKAKTPSYLNFDVSGYPWKANIDYRTEPGQYRVGKGEQGVLICEPYKSEIGRYWRFKTPEIAKKSSEKIYGMFLDYLKQGEFVGADLARKYLQMGYTRARRYANYKGGIKYNKDLGYSLNERGSGDPEKAQSAAIFYGKYKQAEANPEYAKLKAGWKKMFG